MRFAAAVMLLLLFRDDAGKAHQFNRRLKRIVLVLKAGFAKKLSRKAKPTAYEVARVYKFGARFMGKVAPRRAD